MCKVIEDVLQESIDIDSKTDRRTNVTEKMSLKDIIECTDMSSKDILALQQTHNQN